MCRADGLPRRRSPRPAPRGLLRRPAEAAPGSRHARRRQAALAFCLTLCAPAAAASQGADCDAPGSRAERAVCREAALRELDARLRRLYPDARAHSADPAAFEAEHRQWLRDKRDACTTDRCLDTTYRTRIDALRLRIVHGRPPLLTPGRYRRPAAADGPVLEVEALEPPRYRLRVLPSPDAAPVLDGEFEERVGSARFESGACGFDLRFAPDLVSLSGAGAACAAPLDGDYLRGAGDR